MLKSLQEIRLFNVESDELCAFLTIANNVTKQIGYAINI